MGSQPRGGNTAVGLPTSNRLQQLDALRGLAALLVIISHASGSLAPYAIRNGHGDLLAQFAQGADIGRIGVVIFFIVSGFVVVHTLAAREASLAKFATRRLFRLYPLYWLSILLVIYFNGSGNYLLSLHSNQAALLANMTMLPTVFGLDPMMGVYWTLETELVFYLAAVVVYKAGYLFKPMALFWMICALIITFAAVMFGVLPMPRLLSWRSMALHLSYMFWGALFHAVIFNPALRGQRARGKFLLLVAAGIILSPSVYTFIRYFSSHSADDLRWAVSYPAAVIIFGFMFFVTGRWIRWVSGLGVISYSMYLLHPFAIATVSTYLGDHGIGAGMASLPVLTAVTTGITVAVSVMSYMLLEKPCMAFGRRLTTKIAQKPKNDST